MPQSTPVRSQREKPPAKAKSARAANTLNPKTLTPDQTGYCKGVPNQKWLWNPNNGTIVSLDGGGKCLQAGYPTDAPGSGWEGRLITTEDCDLTKPGQIFVWDTDTTNSFAGFIKLAANPNFCVDAGHMGQTITWDPMYNVWARNPVSAGTCPDAGQRPFLPRTFAEDYTVGYYRVGSDFVLERLVILDGDESDNNVWYSDGKFQRERPRAPKTHAPKKTNPNPNPTTP
jgi:hypothetical protein